MAEPQLSPTSEQTAALLERIQQRLDRIEAHLGLQPIPSASQSETLAATAAQSEFDYSEGHRLELRLGEFGLAWLGSLILLLGIAFLMTYTFSFGQNVLACALGYVASGGLYLIARSWRETMAHLSKMMLTGSLLLLYYSTMRLHFFTDAPLVQHWAAGFLLLLGVAVLELIFAVRRGSAPLAGMAVALGLFTTMLSDRTHIMLALAVVYSIVSARLALRKAWWGLLNVSIVLVYATHLGWALNNPAAGHALEAVSEHQYNVVYLFLYAIVFSYPVLSLKLESTEDAPWLATILLNAFGFSLVTSLVAFAMFRESFAGIYLAAAVGCLAMSVAHWIKTHQELAPAIYACFGYLALSIAIYGYEGIPAAFVWLAWQSLLVVSMALWFRSRVLVVSNTLIYVCMLMAYMISAGSSDLVNFSFALVALASARVMNWQKERLTLRTNLLRNVYLALGFVLVLYALYCAVPSHYVTLTWTAAAVAYFTLSVVLSNIKYRWMAISTMFMTVGYLFFVDLARLDAIYRVAAFLFLGVMALLISIFYTRYKRFLGKTGT